MCLFSTKSALPYVGHFGSMVRLLISDSGASQKGGKGCLQLENLRVMMPLAYFRTPRREIWLEFYFVSPEVFPIGK